MCWTVNATGLEAWTTREIRKKWLNVKMDVRRGVAAHRKSVAQTGGGRGEGRLTSFEERVASLIGRSAISGVIAAHVDNSDHPQGEHLFHLQLHCLNG